MTRAEQCDQIALNKKQENILKYVDFYLFREKYKNNYWIQD